ncbi:F-box domain-containing protein [Mycena sanguinolenta]|uniref:F-box domain-containing protein n=1 Tax=Mycena sanguinolenta TaxID=230812 RepID=A0A8H6Z8X3_9AGAR|nr:F-box domain-containing protein [Mycena sanguinolenta]
MRALSALPFDDDLLHLILSFCPTFADMQDMALVSKSFLSRISDAPKGGNPSINNAVACNLVGPALPQALRVIRYPYPVDRSARDEQGEEPLATACPEADMACASIITLEEEKQLCSNAEIVETLEDAYSLTQKDRTSKRSVLTWEESFRFRRAMYRIMFYCKLFNGDVDDREEDVQLIRRQRIAVLSQYPTDQLLQLYAVVQFMRGILQEVCNEADIANGMVDLMLSAGPEGLSWVWEDEAYERLSELDFERLDEDEEDRLYDGYFSRALDSIWAAREVEAPKDVADAPASKWILDTVVGAEDTCSQCTTLGGLKLLTQANWHRIHFSPTRFLKGELRHNTVLTEAFKDVEYMEQHEHGPWISKMFDFTSTNTNETKEGEWAGWTSDRSYCQPCLFKFMEEHVWQWFREERVKDGWVPPAEDCPYGYDCKTMGEDEAHAVEKNHLCAPTMSETQVL